MSNRKCQNCYYCDVCPRGGVCGDFAPITNDDEDSIIEEIIEQGRKEYRTAWVEYTSEYQG